MQKSKIKMQNDNSKFKNKRWIVAKKKSDDIIEQLLINRGIPKKDWEIFLRPDFFRDLHDPFLMKDMEKAVNRIWQAINENQPIGIFADYDADGVPGAALLYETIGFIKEKFEIRNSKFEIIRQLADKFKYLNSKLCVYIPAREEGYGLNNKAIDEFAGTGIELLITIDCGITAKKEINYALKKGMETIVIDHHEVIKEKFPEKAIAVLDPKRPLCKYPFKELSACGLVFKLAQALCASLKIKSQKAKCKMTRPPSQAEGVAGAANQNAKLFQYPKEIECFLKWNLDLVAISTICDMVPLIDENRVLAKYGLMVLQKTKRVGLLELYKAAGIEKSKISTYAVGFQIGPRINAPGRMDHASKSFYLLIGQEKKETKELAEYLNKINIKRQEELERVFKEAENEVIRSKLDQKKIIMLSGKNWPDGVVGLAAGNLMEKYCRPTLVFRETKEGLRGSARSIEGFHLVEALTELKNYLESFGGHARAAGLRLNPKRFDAFYDQLLKLADKKLKDKDLIPRLKIDMLLDTNKISLELYKKLKQLEPYGLGNPRPVFALRNAVVNEIRKVGVEGKHLKLKLKIENCKLKILDAVGFDMGERTENLSRGDKIDIAFSLDENVWNGRARVDLKLADIKITSNQ